MTDSYREREYSNQSKSGFAPCLVDCHVRVCQNIHRVCNNNQMKLVKEKCEIFG